jgi:6-phosphogluconate dehydrogenase
VQIAIIGLGRMGMNMAKRLLRGNQEVIVYNRTPEKTERLVKEDAAAGAYSLSEVVARLSRPRIVWLMLPAGPVVDEHIVALSDLLEPEDIIVDGGNTFYKDDIRRAGLLAEKDIHYMDAGVSGGIWGLKIGYCLMLGGEKRIFHHLEPIFETLAPKEGYLYCGEVGAGHFVKMVHNGIEYGMMQAYAEGFQIL